MNSRPARTSRLQLLSLVFLAALSAGLAGCGGAAGPAWSPAPPVTEGPPFVELTQLDGPAPLAGDRVDGGAGDWLLRNERLAVVVKDVLVGGSEGRIVDAAPTGGRDVLDGIVLWAGPASGGAPEYRDVFYDASADTSGRVLVLHGRGGRSQELDVETRLALVAGSNALRITTRVTNRGDELLVLNGWGDAAAWGEAAVMVPGADAGTGEGGRQGPFLVAAGEGTGYAWVLPQTLLNVEEGGSRLLFPAPAVRLTPGESAAYERLFIVCAGSWPEAAGLAWSALGETPAHVLVTVVDPHGALVADAMVEARDGAGRLWMAGLSGGEGVLALPVPEGRYELRASHPERRVRDGKTVSVDAGGIARAKLKLTDPGRARLSATDQAGRGLASRWVLAARDSEGSLQRSLLVVESGEEVLLPPGDYDAVVTHGPAYEPWSGPVRVGTDTPRPVRAVLNGFRATGRWVTADFNPRATDEELETERLRALAADGFRFAIGASSGARSSEVPGTKLQTVTSRQLSRTDFVRIPLGGDLRSFQLAWEKWLAFLAAERPVVAIAGSPVAIALRRPPSANWPEPAPEPMPYRAERNLVDVGDNRQTDAREFIKAVDEGRVQGTLGPLIEFNLNGSGLGSAVEVEPGPVRGHVRVVAPRTMDVREILIYVNNRVQDVYRVRGGGPVPFDEDIELQVSEPGFVLVRVDGLPAPSPGWNAPETGASDRENEKTSQPLRPLGFTNPIRVAISGPRR